MGFSKRSAVAVMALCCVFGAAGDAVALDPLRFVVKGQDAALTSELRAASNTATAVDQSRVDGRDLLAAALSDYGRLIETLYKNGHYSGVVRIRLNGQEAAQIQLLQAPQTISSVSIEVDPGPAFQFGTARITPLPAGTALPDTFQTGALARSTAIRDGVETAVDAWRNAGHAKAAPAGQQITADHAANTLSAEVQIAQGPRARFGSLQITSPSAVRASRIKRIAGLPEGEVFSPATLDRVGKRLRRTGAFASVSLREAARLGPDDTLDITATVVDAKPRRFGFGAEVSSDEGMDLTGFWMHRNIFGGAERLRIEGALTDIGARAGGMDYSLGARLEIPAVVGPDTTGFASFKLEHKDEPSYEFDRAMFGVGATWFARDDLHLESGIAYSYSKSTDAFGTRTFSLLAAPTLLTWDRRDDALDPTGGYYLKANATPYLGIGGSASGARLQFDARAYRQFGAEDGLVLAGRAQLGSVIGSGLNETHPDFLFYSGGGGTVRGQPFHSLNVDHGGGLTSGGRSFLGLSVEARKSLTEKIGAVAFADAGYVGRNSFVDGTGGWHSGAGIGLRYKTGLGPIRFDVAAPIGGTTGSGVQIYIGIGQAF